MSVVMGKQTLPAYRVDLTSRIIPTEQDKSIPLPRNKGNVHRKMNDGGADSRSGRKRRLLCNGADTGCVSRIDHITGRESGPTSLRCFTRENEANRHMRQADDDGKNRWCGLKRSGGVVCH